MGLEWVVLGTGRVSRCAAAGGRLLDHPPGPVGSLWDPPCPGPLECRLRANTARLRSFSQKLSQNGEVSPEMSEKASHSPYFQNGLQKSALDFLRFPFLAAFSHKELMVAFWPTNGLYCQNDEVSLICTPLGHAKGSSDTPTDRCSKLPLPVCSSSDSARGPPLSAYSGNNGHNLSKTGHKLSKMRSKQVIIQ